MSDNLDALFSPRSIAVIGASRKKGGIGRKGIKSLVMITARFKEIGGEGLSKGV